MGSIVGGNFLLLFVMCVSQFTINAMEKDSNYYNPYRRLKEKKLEGLKLTTSKYKIQSIIYPPMGKIDKAILERKLSLEGGNDDIRSQWFSAKKHFKINTDTHIIYIPPCAIIRMEFFKVDKDPLTKKIYSKFNYDKKKGNYKPIDNCTKIKMVWADEQASSIVCKTKLYDSSAVGAMITLPDFVGAPKWIWTEYDKDENGERDE